MSQSGHFAVSWVALDYAEQLLKIVIDALRHQSSGAEQ
jgi:hypothetical protein